MDAQAVSSSLYEWARTNGALSTNAYRPAGEGATLREIFETDEPTAEAISTILRRIKLVTVACDDERQKVTVLCKNAVSDTTKKKLPTRVYEVDIEFIGKSESYSNPPPLTHSAEGPNPLWFTHAGVIACGSSVTAAPIPGAGTIGFLATLADGRIVGVSNNHVTGDCNHTPTGMHILSPAPIDASPASPAPLAIGKHLAFEPLHSGDPGQIQLQELDVALFELIDPNCLSSIQGNGFYDTPSQVANPAAGMRVKKVGRTTGLTSGAIVGATVFPYTIPYRSAKFNSHVHFTGVWLIVGDNGAPFSQPGDSGSLVVTEDGSRAVGLLFAGSDTVSAIIPIRTVLDRFNLSILSEHNAEMNHGDGE